MTSGMTLVSTAIRKKDEKNVVTHNWLQSRVMSNKLSETILLIKAQMNFRGRKGG